MGNAYTPVCNARALCPAAGFFLQKSRPFMPTDRSAIKMTVSKDLKDICKGSPQDKDKDYEGQTF